MVENQCNINETNKNLFVQIFKNSVNSPQVQNIACPFATETGQKPTGFKPGQKPSLIKSCCRPALGRGGWRRGAILKHQLLKWATTDSETAADSSGHQIETLQIISVLLRTQLAVSRIIIVNTFSLNDNDCYLFISKCM